MYVDTTNIEYKHNYDLEKLDSYKGHSDYNIARLQKAIEREKEYQQAIDAHKEKVAQTPTEKVVLIEREKNIFNKLVFYYVTLEDRPILPEEERVVNHKTVHGRFIDRQKFQGRERHDAFAYASDLADKYDARIERKGFKK